ncbi:winged helix-turn-helix domain-containing protein [Jatrophihabitans sp. DSM 45814]
MTGILDPRERRGEARFGSRDPVDPGVVTLLVIAVPGTVDPRWLSEIAESQVLAAQEFSASEQRPYVSLVLPGPPTVRSAGCLAADSLQMDLDEMRVRLAGRTIDLTHQEFLLLKAFMQSPRQVFSRRQLLEQAWGYRDPGIGRTVDVHVRRVRVKLGPAAPQIVTVRGFGYRFEPAT